MANNRDKPLTIDPIPVMEEVVVSRQRRLLEKTLEGLDPSQSIAGNEIQLLLERLLESNQPLSTDEIAYVAQIASASDEEAERIAKLNHKQAEFEAQQQLEAIQQTHEQQAELSAERYEKALEALQAETEGQQEIEQQQEAIEHQIESQYSAENDPFEDAADSDPQNMDPDPSPKPGAVSNKNEDPEQDFANPSPFTPSQAVQHQNNLNFEPRVTESTSLYPWYSQSKPSDRVNEPEENPESQS
jgi:actin-related protein